MLGPILENNVIKTDHKASLVSLGNLKSVNFCHLYLSKCFHQLTDQNAKITFNVFEE